MFCNLLHCLFFQQHHHGLLGSAEKVGFAQISDNAMGVLDDTAAVVSTVGSMPKFANCIDSQC